MTIRTIVASAALAALVAAPASATILHVDFTIHPGNWVQAIGAGSPFGLSSDPGISGSLEVDTTDGSFAIYGFQELSAINYVTGTRTWTLADIDLWNSGVRLQNGLVGVFDIGFGDLANGPFDYFLWDALDQPTAYSAAVIGDQISTIVCNACITVSGDVWTPGAVPEPATWALMLAGFGLAGAALRRRRPSPA